MDELRLQAVAARVVAWHNLHPLARRITAAQVKAIGYVAFSVGADAVAAPVVAPHIEPEVPPPRPTPAPVPAPVEVDYTEAFAALAETADLVAAAPAAEAPLSQAERVQARAEAAVAAPDIALDTLEGFAEAAQPVRIPEPASGAMASSLRDRARARAQEPEVQGAFMAQHGDWSHAPATEPAGGGANFMAPLSSRDVARWVLRHGRMLVQAPGDAPLRRVAAPAMESSPLPGTRYVLTAAIDGGALRSRVLLGAGQPAAVLGPRLLSPPRVVAALIAGCLLLGLALALALALVLGLGLLAPSKAKPEASAAWPAHAAPAAESAHEEGTLTHPAPVAQAPVAASAAEALRTTTARPTPAWPQRGRVTLQPLFPPLSDDDKAAARQARTDALAARGGAAPAPTAGATAAQAPVAPPPAGPVYAVSTRALRTRAEAELLQAAIGALLKATGATAPRLELLPEGDDWRVVAMPFADREQAEKARALLAGRGMRVEVLGF